MSARRLSMVSRSTLRGVLGVGGTGSALATGGVAETASALLTLGLAPTADAAGLGGAGSVLHDSMHKPAHDTWEIRENRADLRGTLRAPQTDAAPEGSHTRDSIEIRRVLAQWDISIGKIIFRCFFARSLSNLQYAGAICARNRLE